MNIDDKLKQDMYTLLGQIDAISYSFSEGYSQGYCDLILIDAIRCRYESILKRTVGFEE